MSQLNEHPYQDEVAFFKEWFMINTEAKMLSYEVNAGAFISCLKAYGDRYRRKAERELTTGEAADLMREVDEKWRREIVKRDNEIMDLKIQISRMRSHKKKSINERVEL